MAKEVSDQVKEFFDENSEGWEEQHEEEEEESFFGPSEEEEEKGEDGEEGAPASGEGEGEGEDKGGEVDEEEEGQPSESGTPAEEEEEEEGTPPADDQLSARIAELEEQNRTLLENMQKLMDGKGKEEETETPTSGQPPKTDAPSLTQNEDGTFDFVGDLDIDDVVSDKEQFNAVLNKAVQTALGSVQNVYQQLPTVVKEQINTQSNINKAVENFYSDNKDLAPVKKTVGYVANEVAAEHPDWELPKIFEETATRTRKLLGLKKKIGSETPDQESQPSSDTSPRKPALPSGQKTGGKRGGKGQLTGQAKHIADVL